MGSEAIVINEMNAFSPLPGDFEWVEIINTSDKAFNLNGYSISDKEAPSNADEVLRFPADAVIPGGAYFLILLDQAPEMPPQKHTDCVPGTPPGTVCYYAKWKVSATSGDRVFYLAPNGDVISVEEYPDPVVAMVFPKEGETWARLPDKTGVFGVGVPTPGAPNMPVMP
jgi:hypothetical protein